MKHDSNGHVQPSAQEVAALRSRYRASGLGLTRFAREEGIPYGRRHYWLYQKPRAGGCRRSAQGKDLMAAPVFQEVKLAGGLPPACDWAVAIRLPNGLITRFPPATSTVWGGAVVQALHRPC